MSALTGIPTKMLLLMLCFIAEFTSAQVTFNPDLEEDVQLQMTSLTPPVEITTVDKYILGIIPRFKVQYVTIDDSAAVYDIIDIEGQPVSGSAFERLFSSQYKTVLNSLTFIEDSRLIGGTFRLKATLNNDEDRSTLSRRTYTFPAPFNLTGSSVRAMLNSPFTWTCHVTSDYPIIEWYRDSTSLTQIGILLNGSCLSFGKTDSYVYGCHWSELTYTLTIPGTSLVEELQSSNWRCKEVSTGVKGSVFMELNIVVPVTTVIISPGRGSALEIDVNQLFSFTCIVNNADPYPAILWFIGSTDVTSQALSNRTTLVLNVTREYHNVAVKCVAWNSGNTANLSDSTTLTVRGLPDDPSDFRVLAKTITSVTFTWGKGYNGGYPQKFVVLYKEKASGVYSVNQVDDSTPNTTITEKIKCLKSDTRYEFLLYSFNEKGNSTSHQALEVRTSTDNKSESDSTGSGVSGATVGGVAGASLLIIAILVSLMVVRERRYRKEKGQRATNAPIQLHENDSHRGINQQGTGTHPNNADQRSNYEELQSQRDVHTYGHIGSGSANAQGLDQSCAYEDLQTTRDVHTYGHVGSRPLYIEMR